MKSETACKLTTYCVRKRLRRRSLVVVALLFVSATLVATGAQRQKDPPPRSGFGAQPSVPVDSVRTTTRTPGTRLDRLVQSTDSILEVVDEQEYGSPPPPAPPGDPNYGKSRLQLLTERSVVIALVTVTSQRGELTPSGDWVRNNIRSEVVSLLKNSTTTPLSAGDTITFTANGGEVSNGRQTIRARHRGAKLWDDGRTYLVFVRGSESEAGRTVFSTVSTQWLLDEGDTFTHIAPGEAIVAERSKRDAILSEISLYSQGR